MATNVVLRFLGDSTSLDRTFKKVGAESQTFGTRMSKGMALAGVSLAGAGIAAVGFAKSSIAAFKEAEIAQTKLQDAFKRFPALADTNIASLRKLNTELARKTRFDDDATASGQAVLAQFKLTGTQIKTLTPLLQDYAARTGKDLPTAATDLGRALNGQGRALKAIGIDFKATGDRTADLERLTGLLNQKVGGFAEREGKTAAGQAEILKNKMGELQEKVGAFLVPALTKLVDLAGKVADWFDKLSPSSQRLIGVTLALAAAVVVLNVAMSANPVVLIAAGIAALVIALVAAYNKFELFRNIVQGVMKAVEIYLTPPRLAIEAIVKALQKAWELAGKVAGAVGKIPGAGVVKNVGGFLGGLIPGFAEGGIVPGPAGAPRLAVVHGGERVLTQAQQRGGGGTTVNIYTGANPTEVIAAIKRYERVNGSNW